MTKKLFGGAEPDQDKELERQRREEKARLAREKEEQEQRAADEADARKRGLRGITALLSGSRTGYGSLLGG